MVNVFKWQGAEIRIRRRNQCKYHNWKTKVNIKIQHGFIWWQMRQIRGMFELYYT